MPMLLQQLLSDWQLPSAYVSVCSTLALSWVKSVLSHSSENTLAITIVVILALTFTRTSWLPWIQFPVLPSWLWPSGSGDRHSWTISDDLERHAWAFALKAHAPIQIEHDQWTLTRHVTTSDGWAIQPIDKTKMRISSPQGFTRIHELRVAVYTVVANVALNRGSVCMDATAVQLLQWLGGSANQNKNSFGWSPELTLVFNGIAATYYSNDWIGDFHMTAEKLEGIVSNVKHWGNGYFQPITNPGVVVFPGGWLRVVETTAVATLTETTPAATTTATTTTATTMTPAATAPAKTPAVKTPVVTTLRYEYYSCMPMPKPDAPLFGENNTFVAIVLNTNRHILSAFVHPECQNAELKQVASAFDWYAGQRFLAAVDVPWMQRLQVAEDLHIYRQSIGPYGFCVFVLESSEASILAAFLRPFVGELGPSVDTYRRLRRFELHHVNRERQFGELWSKMKHADEASAETWMAKLHMERYEPRQYLFYDFEIQTTTRPISLPTFLGPHEAYLRKIANQLIANTGRLQQGLLFYGPPGVGKTTMARFLAKLLSWDIVQIGCRQIRDARDLQELFKKSHLHVLGDRLPPNSPEKLSIQEERVNGQLWVLDEIDLLGESLMTSLQTILDSVGDLTPRLVFAKVVEKFILSSSTIKHGEILQRISKRVIPR